MSKERESPQEPGFEDLDNATLQKLTQMDNVSAFQAMMGSMGGGSRKTLTKVFIFVVLLTLVLSVGVSLFAVRAIRVMSNAYTANVDAISRTKADIETANNWERLPVNQRRERLRTQYYEIVRYYTNNVPPTQKMNDDQILATFNTLSACVDRVPSVNFFIPMAYMKVATNFNPIFGTDYRRGIAAFYYKLGTDVGNLPLVKTDPAFQTVFKGNETLNNPNESIKLLVAEIDDLMTTFNGRVDWVFLSLFDPGGAYNVMAKYWNGGDGKIPDNLYKSGPMADALKYYQAFKDWQIPSVSEKQ